MKCQIRTHWIYKSLFPISIAAATFQSENVTAQFFSEQQSRTSDIPALFDGYGSSVCVSDKYLLVGAHLDSYDLNGGNYQDRAGSAYIYSLNKDSLFTDEKRLISPDRFTLETFGSSTAIWKDVLAIGADGSHLDENQTNFFLYAGAVYIGKKNSAGDWAISQKLVATFRNENDFFGRDIAISGDMLAVGAINHDMDSAANMINNAGSVFVFKKDALSNYSLFSHITASDRNAGNTSGKFFGSCVYFQDSLNLFIGAELERAVYYFKRNSSGQWIEQQKIVALNGESGSFFGSSIAVSGDYLSVGAYSDRLDNAGQNSKIQCGSIYLFKKDKFGVWNQSQRLVAPFREGHMEYGKSVVMQGRILVVGAPGASSDENNIDSIRFTGSVIVYYLDDNNTWQLVQRIVKQDRKQAERLGTSLSYHMNLLVVGSGGGSIHNQIGFANIYIGTNPFVGFKPLSNELNHEISVYPNPTSRIFTLNSIGRQLDRVLVYSVNGKLVYEENLKGKESSELYLPDNILNGLYLVRIESNGEVVNKKLVVNGR